MSNLTTTTGSNVVTADKAEQYGFDWAKQQLENIATFSKEFIAAARGKVFLTIQESHTTEEFLAISTHLGFDKAQVYRYVDYAKKEGMIAHIKSVGFQNKLPMNVVNALPENKEAAGKVLAEANVIANGKTVTKEIIEKATTNLGLGLAGVKKLDVDKMMSRGEQSRKFLLNKGYTAEQLTDYAEVNRPALNTFRTAIEAAVDNNYPKWDVFYKAVKPTVEGENLKLLEEMNEAITFYYIYKVSELHYEDLAIAKEEFNALFLAGKIK